MLLIANMNLATLDCQIISKYLAIHGLQNTSDDLATKNSKSLAIKMTLVHVIKQCWWRHDDIIKPKEKGIHVIFSTPPTENLLKTKYMVKTWL